MLLHDNISLLYFWYENNVYFVETLFQQQQNRKKNVLFESNGSQKRLWIIWEMRLRLMFWCALWPRMPLIYFIPIYIHLNEAQKAPFMKLKCNLLKSKFSQICNADEEPANEQLSKHISLATTKKHSHTQKHYMMVWYFYYDIRYKYSMKVKEIDGKKNKTCID